MIDSRLPGKFLAIYIDKFDGNAMSRKYFLREKTQQALKLRGHMFEQIFRAKKVLVALF